MIKGKFSSGYAHRGEGDGVAQPLSPVTISPHCVSAYTSTHSANTTASASCQRLHRVNIFVHGIWLICGDREYFLPYEAFPWFENAPVKHVFY